METEVIVDILGTEDESDVYESRPQNAEVVVEIIKENIE